MTADAVSAAVHATPGLTALLGRDRGDDQRDERVGPGPAQQKPISAVDEAIAPAQIATIASMML